MRQTNIERVYQYLNELGDVGSNLAVENVVFISLCHFTVIWCLKACTFQLGYRAVCVCGLFWFVLSPHTPSPLLSFFYVANYTPNNRVTGCVIKTDSWPFCFLFAALIEEGYHSNNPYHNAVHAADVSQSMYCFLREAKVNNYRRCWFSGSSIQCAGMKSLRRFIFTN